MSRCSTGLFLVLSTTDAQIAEHGMISLTIQIFPDAMETRPEEVKLAISFAQQQL